MYLVLLFSLFISILLEASVVALPLAFILLLCYSILKRTSKVFLSAFLTGLLLDLFVMRPLGATSIYFLLFFAFVLLYQKKYEIKSYTFVMVSAYAGSYFYLLLLGDKVSFLQPALSSILAVVIFGIGKKIKGL